MTRLEGLRVIATWRPDACVRVGSCDSVAQVRALVALADGPLRADALPPGVVGALVRRRLVTASGGRVSLTEAARVWMGDDS